MPAPRAKGKPVLLSITAAWCRACHEMDRTTYADPGVAALIRDRFVAVRVDTDRRPDINERYNLGGWPTTAFLTADGDVITGGTFVPRRSDERCPRPRRGGVRARRGVLACGPTREARGPRRSATGEGGRATSLDDVQLIESIFSTFDEEHGGFGVEPKFPHTAPLHLAMALFRETGDERWRRDRRAHARRDGRRRRCGTRRAGGFYRYATTRDWQLPHTEKLLETNAELLRAYAEAALVFERQVDRDRCAAIAGFITGALRAEAGGYRGSDADGMLYMDGNAKAAGALLGAATVLDDSALAQEALASFERVILLCYKPGAGARALLRRRRARARAARRPDLRRSAGCSTRTTSASSSRTG